MKNYNKEELSTLIFDKKLSYIKIGKMYGVTDETIKKAAKKLGIILPKRANFKDNFVPANKGTAKIIKCKECDKNIKLTTHPDQTFCSRDCYYENQSKEIYAKYLNNQHEYCHDRNMSFIKKHILLEQNCKCAVCGIKNEWNNIRLVFILDHIDGNAYNNFRINLRLVCPNCDSQLDTYKSKNKNSSRKTRYLKSKNK